MAKKTVEQALAAKALGLSEELADISRQEMVLTERRQKAETALWQVLSSIYDLTGTSAVTINGSAKAAFVPAIQPTERSTGKGPNPHVAARRQYIKAAVAACREMLLTKGRPMTMDEIHAAHPERTRLSRELLFDALDQRSRYDVPTFIAKNGVFWLPDKPFPLGWRHPKGVDWGAAGPASATDT